MFVSSGMSSGVAPGSEVVRVSSAKPSGVNEVCPAVFGGRARGLLPASQIRDFVSDCHPGFLFNKR